MNIKKTLEDLTEKLKGKSKKKIIETSVAVIIVGIILVVTAGSIFKKTDKITSDAQPKVQGADSEQSSEDETMQELEKRIAAILSGIEGAGRVKVMITCETGVEIIPAVDSRTSDSQTVEEDSEGGTRRIRQEESDISIAYKSDSSGASTPIILKSIQPKALGVVVVCDGGSDPAIKERVTRAVQALVDVPLHRIQVFKHKK